MGDEEGFVEFRTENISRRDAEWRREKNKRMIPREDAKDALYHYKNNITHKAQLSSDVSEDIRRIGRRGRIRPMPFSKRRSKT
jgi:hypothetical protein